MVFSDISDHFTTGNHVTTQADLDFWNSTQAQYLITEAPVFVSKNSKYSMVYDFVPAGVSKVMVLDNSVNALDSTL